MEDLLDGCRDVADIGDLRSSAVAHQERRLLDGVVPDREDEIGALDRVVNVVALRQRSGAEIELGNAGHRALAHLGIEEGDLRAADEVGQGLHQPRPVAGGADHHQRTFGGEDHVYDAPDSRGRGDRPVHRMRRNQRSRGLFRGDILGQFQMHGTGTFLGRDAEGVAHCRGNRVRRNDLPRQLGDRPHRADDVDQLEARLPRGLDRLLAGDHDHRHGAEIGVGRAGGEIQRAGAERRQADAGRSREPPLRGRHEGRGLFVARQHQLDLGMPQRLDHREVFLARQPEDALDTFVFQRRYQKVGALGAHQHDPLCSAADVNFCQKFACSATSLGNKRPQCLFRRVTAIRSGLPISERTKL